MSDTSTGSEQAESTDTAPGEDDHGPGRVVVGVDGSDGSLVALGWAVDEARRRDIFVHMVLAWQMPEAYGPINIWGADVAQDIWKDCAEKARDDAERLAKGVDGGPGVNLSWEVVQEHPARALVGVAHAEDLLVVGSRGYGGFVGALLGSVSQHVVSHAVCPVVVVPRPHEESDHGRSQEQRSYRSGVFGQAHEHYQGGRGSGVYEQGHAQPAGQGVFEQGRNEVGEGAFDQGRPHPEDV